MPAALIAPCPTDARRKEPHEPARRKAGHRVLPLIAAALRPPLDSERRSSTRVCASENCWRPKSVVPWKPPSGHPRARQRAPLHACPNQPCRTEMPRLRRNDPWTKSRGLEFEGTKRAPGPSSSSSIRQNPRNTPLDSDPPIGGSSHPTPVKITIPQGVSSGL